MEEGKRYWVEITHNFEGVFEGVVEENGQMLAVFATDSAPGNPSRTSGRRYIPVDHVMAKEVFEP